MSKILVITGKSSSGKDSLQNYLVSNYDFINLVSHTTRPPRPNESNGYDYYFINKEDFVNMNNKNSFIDAVNEIDDEKFVLPVIQRSLVWTEEKMELLFDTLLKGDSFGGIMAIEEEKDKEIIPKWKNANGSLVDFCRLRP